MAPTDHHGRPVVVGTKVRVLKIALSLKANLPSNEWDELQTMVGQVFKVTEVDEYGHPWVEKWWKEADRGSFCHSLALESDEMEVVPPSTTRPRRGASRTPSRRQAAPARSKRPKGRQ